MENVLDVNSTNTNSVGANSVGRSWDDQCWEDLVLSSASNVNLLIACRIGNTTLALDLIKYGANVNIRDDEGRTPLHDASKLGSDLLVLSLIENGADINEMDYEGRTPLHEACKWGKSSTALTLVNNSANVNAFDDYCNTPLRMACRYCSIEVILLAIRRGAILDAQYLEYIRIRSTKEDHHAVETTYELECLWRRRKAYVIFLSNFHRSSCTLVQPTKLPLEEQRLRRVLEKVFLCRDTQRVIGSYL